VTDQDTAKLVETEDKGDVGALVIRAAEQLTFAGPGTRASVRFAMDDQWLLVTLQMIDESEGTR